MKVLKLVLLALVFLVPPVFAIQSRTNTYTYNEFGLITSIDGPRVDVRDVTSFAYDPANNKLTQVTNALDQVTRITSYDPVGRPLVLVDPNGLPIALAYDARGRLISRTVDSKTTAFGYDPVGNLTSVTSPTGLVLTYTYDAARRLTGIRDNLNNHIEYMLDSAGNMIRQDLYDPFDVLTKTQSRTYDELSRLITYTGGASQFNTYSYDKNGNNVSFFDGLSYATTNTFDGLSNLVSQKDAAGGIIQIQYDALDQIQSVTDQNLNTTNYTWSALGDLLAIQSLDTGTTTFSHDEAGNLLTKTDARGVITAFTYDALNRITGIRVPDSSLKVTMAYDQGTNGIGRLTGISVGANQATSYRYDLRGNLIGITSVVDGLVSTMGFVYDDSDQLIQITYPSGHVVDYLRNLSGTITEVQLTRNGVTQTLLSNVAYAPFGPVSSMTYGNGIVQSLTYDLDYRLVNRNNSFQDLDYVYDAADNLLDIDDLFGSIEGRTYAYDPLDRLETRTSDSIRQSYAYDPVGNRLTETVNGVTDHYAYDTDSNRLNSISGVVHKNYSYDANGNITSDGIFNYRYADDNRLAAVETLAGAPVAAYAYNAASQRIKKTVATDSTYYHYGPNDLLIAESDPEGNPITEYFYLDSQPIAVTTTTPEPTADDSGSEFSFTGKWRLSSSLPGYSGSGYHQIASKTEGRGFKKAIWSPQVQPGEYEVFARWPADSGNIPDAKFTVNHASGSTEISADQRQNGGRWNSLGIFILNPNSSVGLSNQSSQKGKVIADAIRLVPTSSPEIHSVHTHHLDTPTALTDANQTVVWSAHYDPFGSAQVAGSIPFNLRLPGQYFDQETGFHYNWHRYYDPATGRYMTSDPIGLQGGLNTYAYVGNNPVNYTDSSGLIVDTLADLGFILYDLYKLGSEGPCERDANLAALGLDIVGAITPGATGLGAASRVANGGTEVVQRAMSRAELENIQRTGLLSRGGRPGNFFVSPSVNANVNRSRQRLALPNEPEVLATLEVPSGIFSQPTRVQPLRLESGGTLPGGGLERIAPGSSDIPVRIIQVDNF